MELQKTREKIDKVDTQIVRLLEERMKLVSEVVQLKQKTGKAVFDKEREKAQRENLLNIIENKDYEQTILDTFESILTYSKEYQNKKMS